MSIVDKYPELKKIPKEKFPNHLLLIPDGNGRWANLAKKTITFGHKKGAEVIKKVYEDLWELPIKYITIWGFSADNWSRSREEAEGIMKVIDKTLEEMMPLLIKRNGRVIHLGREDRIPDFLSKTLHDAEKMTEKNTGGILCIAVDYAGQDQELRMFERMIKDNVTHPTPEILKKYRDGEGLVPPADLIIRTSGEKRTSDLGWLSTNSELYFIDKLLPNVSSKDIVDAIIDYSKRERRFGGRVKK